MIRKKVWRYYCEYCKKAGGSGFHLKNHELHCTLNPNRECGLHKLAGENTPDMDILLSILPDPAKYKQTDEFGGENYSADLGEDTEKVMEWLRAAADNCPLCIMAALRIKGIPVTMIKSFDYKKEFDSQMSEHNNEMNDRYDCIF